MSTRAKTTTVDNWAGGLHKGLDPFDLPPNFLSDVENAQIDLGGSIEPVMGYVRYDDPTGDDTARADPVGTLFRYNKTDGDRETLMNAGDFIYGDNNTGKFEDIGAFTTNDDGATTFAQWRNTVYICSNNQFTQTYNKGATPTTRISTSSGFRGIDLFTNPLIQSQDSVGAGNLDLSKEYYYRFTYDRFHGDDFVGESNTLWRGQLIGVPNVIHDQAGGATATGAIELYKNITIDLPTDVKFINIYRTQGLESADAPDGNNEVFTFWFLGQVTATQFNLKSSGEVVFVDDGTIDVDTSQAIEYRKTDPPAARFATMHKGRMWYSNTSLVSYRTHYSEYRQPEAVLPSSFIDIGKSVTGGEEITGIISWRNKFLMVFTANSTWAIFGGDNETVNAQGIGTGRINVSIDVIDDTVGCIAPKTIIQAEGAIFWLSNKGFVVFDGSSVRPFFSERIDPILEDASDNLVPLSFCGYLPKSRKLYLGIAESAVDSDEIKTVLEYDFKVGRWSRRLYYDEKSGASNNLGVSCAMAITKGDETQRMLIGTNSKSVTLLGTGAHQHVIAIDEGQTRPDGQTGTSWSASTGFMDFGQPHVPKVFHYLITDVKGVQAITVTWDVDDGAATGSVSVLPGGAHSWDEAGLSWIGPDDEITTHVWSAGLSGAVSKILTESAKGRRLKLTFSGTATIPGQKVISVTIGWTPEPETEQ
jgi:hypothetical protein